MEGKEGNSLPLFPSIHPAYTVRVVKQAARLLLTGGHMLTRVTLCLTEPELDALRTVAEREMRGLREQARFLVCTELQRLGLLESDAASSAGHTPTKEARP
jgi:hypothetical protein